MTNLPGADQGVASAHEASLTDADRAFLLGVVAWGKEHRRPVPERETGGSTRDLIALWRHRLAPDWSARLHHALEDIGPFLDVERPALQSDPAEPERHQTSAISGNAYKALDRLRLMHRASARVDLRRVHPSWCVRALREESPTVQRLVAASAPQFVRDSLQAGLLLDSQDLISERAAAPAVTAWVMALWAERLVGGEAERADDPPAIVVLSRLSPRTGYRLCGVAGLCKLILAGESPEGPRGRSERVRREWLEGCLVAIDRDFHEMARRDVAISHSSGLPPRHLSARIGLTTVARLLSASEPFRLRWAMQHWPYPIVKLIRWLMPPDPIEPTALAGESLILRTAWERLKVEGRLALEWPLPPGEDGS
jgi:hypothetical protein